MDNSKLNKYKFSVLNQLHQLSPLLQKYAMGDSSESIPIPEEENEFTELLVGLNLMADDIKELLNDKDRILQEGKQVKETLEESEEKYRLLVENSTYGVAIHSKREILYVNPAVLKLLGYDTKDKILGKNVLEFVHPDFRNKVKSRIKMITKSWEIAPLSEEKFIRKDGQTIDVEVTGIPLVYSGKPAIQVMFNDISKRKQIEENLREREEHYRAVVEYSHNGILIVGEDYKFIYVNDVLCQILDRKREEIIGSDFRKFLDKESKLLVDERYKKRQRGEVVPPRYEFNIVRKNGEKRRVEISSTVVKDSQNKMKTIAQILDITERRRAEEALRESERKYRSIIENSNDGIYLLYKRKFKIINKKFEQMFGYSLEEVNKPDFDFIQLVAPRSRPLVEDRLMRSSRGDILIPKYEFTAFSKDGKELEVEASVSYINYKGGIATQGIIRDVTERKQAENQIRKNLKEKEILLKEVHHRVKNNLNVITSLLNLQSSCLRSKEQAIDAFKESKDRIYAMAMVHEKLYQSGSYSKIDMQDYVKTLAEKLLQIYAPSTKISRSFIIDENINIDINRAIPCGLILNELITNALKHAFAGRSKGKLIVSFHCSENGQYEIKVKDNGIGLPKDIDNKKFETLGLNLVFILTEQLNGKLSIKTKKETEIRIVFPISKK